MIPDTEKRRGILYGVGVGPGDPELMTLKAVRILKEADVVGAPAADAQQSAAFRIAVQSVPEIREKELLSIPMPMVSDREVLRAAHRAGADRIEALLRSGKSVALVILGDPSVYSTFAYLESLVREDGYPTRFVSGVPSFCAAACALGIPLTKGEEALHIIPAAGELPPSEVLQEENRRGTLVFMKCGRRIRELEKLPRLSLAENCGMENERLYREGEQLPEQAGYFSLIIARPGPDRM